MKHLQYTIGGMLIAATAVTLAAQTPHFVHVSPEQANVSEQASVDMPRQITPDSPEFKTVLDNDSIAEDSVPQVRELTVEERLEQIVLPAGDRLLRNIDSSPRVFVAFRGWTDKLHNAKSAENENIFDEGVWTRALADTMPTMFLSEEELAAKWEADSIAALYPQPVIEPEPVPEIIATGGVPVWLSESMEQWRQHNNMVYALMMKKPGYIEKTFWSLPLPPKEQVEVYNFQNYLRKLDLPGVQKSDVTVEEREINKIHWLHVLNTGLQFSQAYLSDNWYQGGNSYLSLLGNFYWDVQLNPVYHPDWMFQSTLSYKLGINSVEGDQYRNYSISEDLFQYNLRLGYKAVKNWYYSFTTQFKTQMLNNYARNTETRIASFLTPGELNLGVGMTYNYVNKKKTIQLNATLAPLSYNLKTAIDSNVDHALYGMTQTERTHNQFGSNGEVTLTWKIFDNVSYRTRLFLFTDYSDFLGDWQNTLDFKFNKFFSTQIYANLRYDSSVDETVAPKWKKWMLKEILSVGLSYTFSTK